MRPVPLAQLETSSEQESIPILSRASTVVEEVGAGTNLKATVAGVSQAARRARVVRDRVTTLGANRIAVPGAYRVRRAGGECGPCRMCPCANELGRSTCIGRLVPRRPRSSRCHEIWRIPPPPPPVKATRNSHWPQWQSQCSTLTCRSPQLVARMSNLFPVAPFLES